MSDASGKPTPKAQPTPKPNPNTGPKSSQGKAISSQNAVKDGTHVSGWLDEEEEAEYRALFNSLCLEYNVRTPTMRIQVERLANAKIKYDRIQKIETAHFLQARQIAKRHLAERPLHPDQTEHERAKLDTIAQLSAMPDMDRLANLQRYLTSLDRQISKIMGEIRVLKDMPTIVSQHSHNLGNTIQTITSYTNDAESVVSTIEEEPSHEPH